MGGLRSGAPRKRATVGGLKKRKEKQEAKLFAPAADSSRSSSAPGGFERARYPGPGLPFGDGWGPASAALGAARCVGRSGVRWGRAGGACGAGGWEVRIWFLFKQQTAFSDLHGLTSWECVHVCEPARRGFVSAPRGRNEREVTGNAGEPRDT